MLADVLGEVLVNFDELGLELRPQSQAGPAVTKVIQGQRHAGRANFANHLSQVVHVNHPLVLGDLQHQHAREHPQVMDQGHQRISPALPERALEYLGTDVDEQAARLLVRTPATQRSGHTSVLELKVQPLFGRRCQQHIWRVKRAALGAPYQRLMGVNRTVLQRHDGLKYRVKRIAAHDGRQRPAALAHQRCAHANGRWRGVERQLLREVVGCQPRGATGFLSAELKNVHSKKRTKFSLGRWGE